MNWILVVSVVVFYLEFVIGSEPTYPIRGRISITNDPGWQARTIVSANFGQYYGYTQENGSFVIPNVKPGNLKPTLCNFSPFNHHVNWFLFQEVT